MTDAYKNLADHIENLSGGYPDTINGNTGLNMFQGFESLLFKRMFSEEEAKLLVNITDMPADASVIANRAGKDQAVLEPMLEKLSDEGILDRQQEKGVALYSVDLNSRNILPKIWKALAKMGSVMMV